MKKNNFLVLIMKLLLLSAVFLFIQIILNLLIGYLFKNSKIAETSASPIKTLSLLFIANLFINIVIFPIILKSKFKGVKLYLSILLIYIGIDIILNYIEVFFFNISVKMPLTAAVQILCTDIIVALFYFPIATFILRKNDNENNENNNLVIFNKFFIIKLVILAFVIYPFIYSLFGNITIQFDATKQYYADIVNNNAGLTIQKLYALQCFRGLIWIGIVLLILYQYKADWKEIAIVTGFNFAIIMAIGLIIPNPYMPLSVRIIHFFEIIISNFIWGFVAVWLLKSKIIKK